MKNWKLFAFDFDGTLVDSYSCLNNVWKKVGKNLGLKNKDLNNFIKIALKEEDKGDLLKKYDRSIYIKNALNKLGYSEKEFNLKEAVMIYWKERTYSTKILSCSIKLLEFLKNKKCIITSVSETDGLPSLKIKRIKASSLANFFNDIIIVGESAESITMALKKLANNYNLKRNECVLINDKPRPINEAPKNGFSTIKIDFEGILKEAWRFPCNPDLRIKNLCALFKILKNTLK
ncbi:MAG: HAD family hydrolase [Candidatus Methanomethylicaceae archaeon]